MRTRIGFIGRRVSLASHVAGSPVTLRWSQMEGGSLDPVTKAVVGGVQTREELVVRALLHWPSIGQGQVRQFQEIEETDVICDFPPDTVLPEGDITFEVDGKQYRQKKVSGRLAASWDVVVGGVRLFRPVLLTRAR